MMSNISVSASVLVLGSGAALVGGFGVGAAAVAARLRGRTAGGTAGRADRSGTAIASEDRTVRADGLVDGLTGLPDRRAIDAVLAECVTRSAGSGREVRVALVDLRDFRSLNDMFGRDVGDAAMVEVAARLGACVGPEDVVLRLAGDEFAVVGPIDPETDDIDGGAAAMLAAVNEPLEVDSYRVTLGSNVGVALVDPTGDVASVMARASQALYRAGLQGPDRFDVHEHSIHGQVSPADIVAWLRNALDDGDLYLVYQPIHSIGGDLIVATEALLRWNHPTEGLLLPDVVLPALEDSGLIVDVGAWVIDEACRQARAWQDLCAPSLAPVVFVNTSARQLQAPGFVTVLEEAIARHGVDPGRICLELGSLSAVASNSAVWRVLREIKAQGVRLALDNFGGDDCSYGIVRRLNLDYLKLSRQLVNARHATAHDDAIARSVVALANALGYSTVAEGVEDPASLERARSLGCEMAQGFYFGVAERPEVIDQFLGNARSVSFY